jgi:hypothetical protein
VQLPLIHPTPAAGSSSPALREVRWGAAPLIAVRGEAG